MDPPRRPESNGRPAPAASAPAGCLLPLLFLLAIAGVVIVSLLLLTQGWIAGVILVLACIFGLPLVQYLLWGRWLSRRLRPPDEPPPSPPAAPGPRAPPA